MSVFLNRFRHQFEKHNLAKSRNFRSPTSKVKRDRGGRNSSA